MKHNNLGNSELSVSEISFGCMSLKADNHDAPAVVKKAIDLGVNFFDTADLYEFGLNEELLAKAISGLRENLIIATKVGNEWNQAKDGWTWNPSKSYILKAVEASLRRLNTDYIDLYQLHGGTIDDPIDDIIETFELLKQVGKIREYGISSIRPNVIKEFAKKSNMASVMMQFSLLDRRPEEQCFKLLAESNISVIARGTLAKGLLAGKPASDYLGHTESSVSGLQNTIREITANYPINPSHIATKYVLRQPVVATSAIGFRTLDQVKDLLGGFYKADLSSDEFTILDNSVKAMTYDNHRLHA